MNLFPEYLTQADGYAQVMKTFKAANTMALIFTVMQLIVLYVGTNRFRIKPTFFGIDNITKLFLYISQDFGSIQMEVDGKQKTYGRFVGL